LKFLRLSGNLRLAAFLQGTLFVHEERQLRGESIEKLSLLEGWRILEVNG
jgi:hypothetical protein